MISNRYVHPLIEMLNNSYPENKMIEILQSFCGCNSTETDQNGNMIYETVDQTEFTAPILQVFAHCVGYGKKSVIDWIVSNFVPLQVSYDNNYCYYESIKWKHHEIADIIINHESFDPSIEILESFLVNGEYAHFKKCMQNPNLNDCIKQYECTLVYYINNAYYKNAIYLLTKLKERISGVNVEINDNIMTEENDLKQHIPDENDVSPDPSTTDENDVSPNSSTTDENNVSPNSSTTDENDVSPDSSTDKDDDSLIDEVDVANNLLSANKNSDDKI